MMCVKIKIVYKPKRYKGPNTDPWCTSQTTVQYDSSPYRGAEDKATVIHEARLMYEIHILMRPEIAPADRRSRMQLHSSLVPGRGGLLTVTSTH